MGAVDGFNEQLQGSPYLLPDDLDAKEGASEILRSLITIQNEKAALDSNLRSMADDLVHSIEADFQIRLIFESNAIEGAGTTMEETADLIRARPPSPDPTAYYSWIRSMETEPKVTDVLGLQEAHDLARTLSQQPQRPLTEAEVRELHSLVMSTSRFGGSYRDKDVEITGSRHTPPDHFDVAEEMRVLVEWMNTTAASAPLAATVVHAWLTHIHPFEDGNGRVARLLANYMLFRAHWPSLIIKSTVDRGEYYNALGGSDEGGDLMPLFGLFTKALHRSMAEMADPVRSRSLLEADLGIDTREDFEWWQRLRGTFTLALGDALRNHGLSLRVVGSVGPSDFELLRRRDPLGNGWFACVDHPDRRRSLLLWFGYNSNSLDLPGSSFPSIFMSAPTDSTWSLHPYEPLMDTGRLEVDEVVLVPQATRDRVAIREGQRTQTMKRDQAAAKLSEEIHAWFVRNRE